MTKASKRQSGSKKIGEFSSPNVPFFLDETNDTKFVVEALRARGIKIKRASEYFPSGTLDKDWLPQVAKNGWLILTRDANWRYDKFEKSTFIRIKARAFVIQEGKVNLNDEEIASLVFKALPAIKDFTRNNSAPFLAKILKSGKVVGITL